MEEEAKIPELSSTVNVLQDEFQAVAISTPSSPEPVKLNPDSAEKEFKVQNDLGNMCFVTKDFGRAVEFYTRALSIQPHNLEVLVNRGGAYNNLRCYRRANEDLKLVLEIDPCHVKGVHRQVKCLWGLNAYKEAVDLIKSKLMIPQLSGVKELAEIKNTAEILLKQHKTGIFDMSFYVTQMAQNTLDGAEYRGPIKVVQIPGKGRGLIATEKINPGQLIIASKPFSLHITSQDPIAVPDCDINQKRVADANNFTQIIMQKLNLEPECREEFYALYPGKELGIQGYAGAVDRLQIEVIQNGNCFMEKVREFVGDIGSTKETGRQRMGVWTLPSFINHSCLESNCTWKIMGDIMFIRAVKVIKKNEEILISYCLLTWPLEQRQALCLNQGFECKCTLCEFEKSEAEDFVKKRKVILEKLEELVGRGARMNAGLALKLITRLESLRQNNPRFNLVLAGGTIQDIRTILIAHEDFKNDMQIISKIHFVTVGTALHSTAVESSCNMITCYILQRDHKMVNYWVNILKKDLIVEYGSEQVLPKLWPLTFVYLEDFGWNSFLKKEESSLL